MDTCSSGLFCRVVSMSEEQEVARWRELGVDWVGYWSLLLILIGKQTPFDSSRCIGLAIFMVFIQMSRAKLIVKL